MSTGDNGLAFVIFLGLLRQRDSFDNMFVIVDHSVDRVSEDTSSPADTQLAMYREITEHCLPEDMIRWVHILDQATSVARIWVA